jgi:hypothetical protein
MRGGHMGSCNCGHLAQVLLNISKDEIHRAAMEKTGDWSEQVTSYCPTSGLEMDRLIFSLFEKGLSPQDIMNLEYLKDPRVLECIPQEKLPLRINVREDVIVYLEIWASLLEMELIESMPLPEHLPHGEPEIFER